MGKGYKHGTSGKKEESPLNFQVKTYPSETELKADKPSENTVGVCTTTTMSSWAFSATEPTEPEVGMVWVCVGDYSTVVFNALKNNTLQVYPLSAKQYVSDKWESIPAWSYQNEEWAKWVTYMYNAGDQCTDITGGWQFVTTRGGCSLGTYTDNGDSITLNGSSSAMQSTSYCTKKAINLTNVTKLWINVTSVSGNHIWFKAGASVSMGNGAVRSDNLLTGHNSIDVSNLDGLYYVALEVYSDKSVNGSVTFDEIWKE